MLKNNVVYTVHCKPGEAYTCLKTASCEAGPGTMHMSILDICIRSLLILDFAARCVFHNSILACQNVICTLNLGII